MSDSPTAPIRDLVYTEAGGSPQRLDVYRATSRFAPLYEGAVLIYLHGGGWRAGDRSHAVPAERLAALGLTTISADYTLTTERPYPQNLEDVIALVAYVDAHRADLGIGDARIFLGGASSGGHLSALAVTKGLAEKRIGPVAGVVSWFAPVEPSSRYLLHRYPPVQYPGGFWDRGLERGARGNDPFRQFIGTEDFSTVTLAEAYDSDPRFHLDRLDVADLPSFLLLVGTRDAVEIRESQRKLFDALTWVGADATLLTIEGADHEGPEFSSPTVLGAVLGHVRALIDGDAR